MKYTIPLLLILASCSTLKHDQKAVAVASVRHPEVIDQYCAGKCNPVGKSDTTYLPADSTGYLDWIAVMNRELLSAQEANEALQAQIAADTACEQYRAQIAALQYKPSPKAPPAIIQRTVVHDTIVNDALVNIERSKAAKAVDLASKQSDRADKATKQRNIWMVLCIVTWVLIVVYVYFKIRYKKK